MATPAIYYISNGSLVADSPFPNGEHPPGAFSYNNTAVMIPSGVASKKVYVYHQINESAFGEEVYSADAASWTSSTIGVEIIT